MCGRYTQIAALEILKDRFRFTVGKLELKPRYNIAPTQLAPVVLNEDGRRLEFFRWGLIPHWAKDPAIGNRMINARAENLLEKPSFKKPFQTRRCLVLADGFYEWRAVPGSKLKTPMRIVMRSGEPFAMAGLWERWNDPERKEVRTFTIITTSANAFMKAIHERMPAILDRNGEDLWLDPGAKPEKLVELLSPRDEGRLEAYEVSRLVNAPANDAPSCLDKVDPE